MKKLLLPLALCLTLCACKPSALRFTDKELELIYSGDNSLQAMPVLQITNQSDSLFLRTPSTDIDVKAEQKNLLFLTSRMQVTMEKEGGIGISAVQVGVARNVFLITRLDKLDKPVETIINPRITAYAKDTVEFVGDGCLSIPKLWGITLRSPWVQVSYQTIDGKQVDEKIEGCIRPDNLTAIIFQHEYDHLKGVLYLDRISKDQLFQREE